MRPAEFGPPGAIVAEIAYEQYFLHKVRAAKTEPYYETLILKKLGATRLEESA